MKGVMRDKVKGNRQKGSVIHESNGKAVSQARLAICGGVNMSDRDMTKEIQHSMINRLQDYGK